jgi:hypothetical protein
MKSCCVIELDVSVMSSKMFDLISLKSACVIVS